MSAGYILACTAVMAGVTYLTRMLPLVLCRGRIRSRFVRSFLHYVPYAVLSAMTLPAVLYSTGSMLSAAAGLVCALAMAYFGRSLLSVALSSAGVVFLVELLQKLL